MSPAAAASCPRVTGNPPSPAAAHVVLRPTRGRGPRRAGLARAGGAALLAAGLYTVACPPYEWWLAAWPVPALLLLPTRRLGVWRAALCGWIFGVALGRGVTPWLVHASLEYFALDHVRASGFVVLLWLVLGSPYALLSAANAWLTGRVPRWIDAVVGAWLWSGMEVLRTLLTGMPWELLGHTQFRNLTLIQIADLGGVYAVSFLMAFVSLAVAGPILGQRDRSMRAGLGGRAAAGILLAATLVYGAQAKRTHAREPAAAPARTIVAVQGNVPNAFRWKRAYFQRMVATYAQLSTTAAPGGADLVVWPENAVNFYLEREPMMRAQLEPIAQLAATGLLLGAPRLTDEGMAYNSAYLLGPDGAVVGTYDKQRLVPLAEYDPFRGTAGARPDAPVYGPGRGDGVLAGAAMKIGVIICYEVLFPGLVRDRVLAGAQVLVNIANDAWLDPGDGVAPRQHFSMAVFRAVETRRFLVRAAGTGVSGFVAPTGAVYASLPTGQAGTTVGRIVLRDDLTPYVRFGETWLIGLGLVLAAAVRRVGA